jgi:hypothetical protein
MRGWHLPTWYPGRMLAGSPYFPLQLLLALFLGWFFSRLLRHRSMVWIWVLPLLLLCYALIAIPTLVPNRRSSDAQDIQNRWLHYFGPRCQPASSCSDQVLDQMMITFPFYLAVVYSLGALLGRKLPGVSRPATKRRFWSVLAVGSVFFLPIFGLALFDLSVAFGKSSYAKTTWEMVKRYPLDFVGMPVALYAPLVAMGGYLIRLAFRMRQEPLSAGSTGESGPQLNAAP